jgi:hypothetical protein
MLLQYIRLTLLSEEVLSIVHKTKEIEKQVCAELSWDIDWNAGSCM